MKVMLIILLSTMYSIGLMASEPVEEDVQVSAKYVKWSKQKEDMPVPKDFYDIPKHEETDSIAIELDDVYPESADEIPNYAPEEAEAAAKPASVISHQ